MPFVEDDTVSRLQRQRPSWRVSSKLGIQRDDDRRLLHGGDFADAHAAMFRETSLDQLLVVDASQKAVCESARETLGQIEFLLPADFKRALFAGRVNRRTV